jgi:hypothetical protein
VVVCSLAFNFNLGLFGFFSSFLLFLLNLVSIAFCSVFGYKSGRKQVCGFDIKTDSFQVHKLYFCSYMHFC